MKMPERNACLLSMIAALLLALPMSSAASGTLDYQACDDAICYLPVSVPVSFTLEFQKLDYQRSSSR